LAGGAAKFVNTNKNTLNRYEKAVEGIMLYNEMPEIAIYFLKILINTYPANFCQYPIAKINSTISGRI
jgi:hypothetical protein